MDVLHMPSRRATPASPPPDAPQPLSPRDLLAISAGFLFCLLISFVFTHRHIFWEDELLGWMLLRDPSFRHMVAAWKLGADGGGFAFYLTGRAWFFLFGPSEISLRMYSAATLGLAFALTWVTARRFFTFPVTAFALVNTWFFSKWLPVHMAEGRFYGLLMLGAVSVVWLTTVPTRRPGPTAAYLYPLTFFLHALLTTSHLLGVVYSAFLLAATIFLDRAAARLRPALYAAAAAAWLLLIPERAAILASARVGKPHFWTTQPALLTFLGAYTAFSAEIALTLLVLATLLVLTLRRNPAGWRTALADAYRAHRPIWIVTLALLLIPIAFVVEGRFSTPVFINRYLMPVTLAQVFLTAELSHVIDWPRFTPAALRTRTLRRFALAAYAAALLAWVFGHTRHFVFPPENYTRAMTALLPRGIPVVCEDAWQFTELLPRQQTSGVDYVYLLDWPESISPTAPLLEVTQYHLMQNWQKAGFFSGSILDRDAFLQTHDTFLVLHQEDRAEPPTPQSSGNPLVARFRATPGYDVRPYAVLTRAFARDRVFLVCRGTCPSSPDPVKTATIPANPE